MPPNISGIIIRRQREDFSRDARITRSRPIRLLRNHVLGWRQGARERGLRDRETSARYSSPRAGLPHRIRRSLLNSDIPARFQPEKDSRFVNQRRVPAKETGTSINLSPHPCEGYAISGRAVPSGCLPASRWSASPLAASVTLETEDSDLRSPDFNRKSRGNEAGRYRDFRRSRRRSSDLTPSGQAASSA